MANQTPIQAFLEKVNAQIDAFQKARKTSPSNRAPAAAQSAVADLPAGVVLEIGNELMITAEIGKLYKSLAKSLGRVVIIDQITAKETRAIRASAFGIQVDVDTSVARQMRAAYLQREQEWSTAEAEQPIPIVESKV